MDQLFAPWRIEWVEREEADSEGCVFCDLPDRDPDRDNYLVAESEHAYVLLNNYPYNPGHALVIPRTHTGTYQDLADEELLGHARLKGRTFEAMRDGLNPDGFNAGLNLGQGSGGSITDHLHTHVVPRWEGDTNFMPVLGDTKVIVQAIDDTYSRLHDAFAAQERATVPDSETAVWLDV